MSKNLKIYLGISYLIILFAFLYFIFTGVEISKLNDFTYYKELQKDLSNYIIDSCFIDRIERNFIGWPIVGNIGGYSANSIMKDNHRIGVEDSHPNMLGHARISEVLYNEYQKIYA